MKKILINAYIEKNLGDDLFLYILANRYPDVCFFANSRNRYQLADNLYIRKNTLFSRIINRCLLFLSDGKLDLNYFRSLNKDGIITIGGSMFIENKKNNIPNNACLLPKPHYIIGCNFGPYYTNNYLKYYKALFNHATDVCFRDKYSFELFHDLGNNIRYAPDIAFSIANNKPSPQKSNKTVLISVMDFRIKHPLINQEKYEKTLVKVINYYIKNGYKVKLISFCKNEGDELAIYSISKKCNSDSISRYLYDGDIEDALRTIKDSDIIIGSRYHANILGIAFAKPTIPLVYSDKMSNELEDINFTGDYVDLRESCYDEKLLTIIKKNRYSELNIKEICNASKYHFSKLDKVLK